MSMQVAQDASEPVGSGFPELNELGRRLEMLRIQRRISKQHLARFAGISRQQLWRVMTGKSELTGSLRERLATALGVAPGELVAPAPIDAWAGGAGAPGTERRRSAGPSLRPWPVSPTAGLVGHMLGTSEPLTAATGTLAKYLADSACLPRTMASLPAGPDGLQVKRQLLNALEDVALERSVALPAAFFEVRRQVLAGEL